MIKKKGSILVVNAGSSSLKVSLFTSNDNKLERLLDAHLKGTKTQQPLLEIKSQKPFKQSFDQPFSVKEGLKKIFDTIKETQKQAFSSLLSIGHRFVHGGSKYITSTSISKSDLQELAKLSDLAPLHNDACLQGIQESLEYFGNIPQVVVFDTAFHSHLPDVASQYAISLDIAKKYDIKRFGFHGISHAYLWETYRQYVQEASDRSKIITVHLGNGCSMTAIKGGKSIDTSMGFTPAEGLVMGTRAGDIDAALVEFLGEKEKKSASQVMELLNFHSGLLGLSGVSSEMNVLLEAYESEKNAKLAVDLFCYRLIKYLGAYLAVLEGAEAIIFSGGIGENSSVIREKIIKGLGWMGCKLAAEANEKARGSVSKPQKISSSDSSVAVYVVVTDENLLIANETIRLCR